MKSSIAVIASDEGCACSQLPKSSEAVVSVVDFDPFPLVLLLKLAPFPPKVPKLGMNLTDLESAGFVSIVNHVNVDLIRARHRHIEYMLMSHEALSSTFRTSAIRTTPSWSRHDEIRHQLDRNSSQIQRILVLSIASRVNNHA